MITFKVSKRKRDEDTEGDRADVQDHKGAPRKRVRRTVKDEPNDDDSIPLRSLPAHSTVDSSVEEEEQLPEREVAEAGRESLLTPPPTLPSSDQQPAPPAPPPSPPPRYWHPYFADQAIRRRKCNKTDRVSRVPAAQSNKFNAGRFYFYCYGEYCSDYNRFGGFICWADKRGIFEDNEKCDCHLPSRADLTTNCGPRRRIFFTCALGRCQFYGETFPRVLEGQR